MRKLPFFSIVAGCLFMTQSAYSLPTLTPTRTGDLIDWISSPSSSGTFTPSYGQMSLSSYILTHFYYSDTWSPVPFNTIGPYSDMSVTTSSPATITVHHDGAYQVNFSLYFSVNESDEDTFTATNYILGIDVNGTKTAVASVYVGEEGSFSLNYNNVLELSSDDEVRFYMKASDTDGPTFSNNIQLENGNGYLMQISN